MELIIIKDTTPITLFKTPPSKVVKILDHYRSTGLIGKATHKPPINPISYYQNIILTISINMYKVIRKK